MGATAYTVARPEWQRMPTPFDPIIRKSQEQFSSTVLAVLEERGMSKADLARTLKAADGPSKKTVYNILNKTHPPNIGQWAQIAKALEIPLWVLLVDGLHKHESMLSASAMRRLVALVDNYVSSSDTKREEIEAVARAAAIVRGIDKSR
jgi:lambda repressor-like predicted transcriptional regulator